MAFTPTVAPMNGGGSLSPALCDPLVILGKKTMTPVCQNRLLDSGGRVWIQLPGSEGSRFYESEAETQTFDT